MEVTMSSTCQEYVRLSQFYCATMICEYDENRPATIQNIIRQLEDVNYAIPEGSLVERHKAEYVGFTALHFAVLERCVESVNLLLENGADPMLTTRDGYSPLRLAAESSWVSQRRCLDLQGQLKHPVLESLLSAQVKAENTVNVSCKNGVSHFHLACMMNHEEALRFFLDVSGVSVDQAVNKDSPILPGYTALHFAVRYGSFEAACLLLERGADLRLGDIAGITPLQLLVHRNLELADVFSIRNDKMWPMTREDMEANEQILDLLLDKLRLINTGVGIPELHVACAKRTTNVEMIERLIEQGADVNAAIDLRAPIRPGYTALHIAAHFNIQTVMLLLKHGADVAAKDVRGVTPFDICVSHFKPEDLLCIIQSVMSLKDISFTGGTELLDVMSMISDPVLIEGMNFRDQVTLDSPLWAGYTMLHLAVEFAQIDCAYDILKKFDYYDPNRLTPKGKVDEWSKRAVQACLNFINMSTRNACGMTALHLAFRQQKRDLVNILLNEIQEQGMTSNPSDFGNLSYLHIMCVEGRTSIVQAYLSSCYGQIDLNDAVQIGFQWYTVFPEPGYARPGSTALHLAVIFQRADIARLLLQHGADPLTTDADGLTPLQLAFATDRLHEPMRGTLLSGLMLRNANPVSNEGLSHFHVACYANDLPVAEELLQHGLADVEAPVNCGLKDTHKDRPEAIKTSQYYTSQYDCSDNFLPLAPFSGYRALHMAVEGQALETVELLLRHGADTQARNTAGLSPVQLALRRVHVDQRSRDIFNRLIENEAECEGLSKLHVACLLKDEAAIANTLEADVDIDARLALDSPIWPGSTALHLLFEGDIMWNTLKPMLELLVHRGGNVNQPNNENSTPVHLAYKKNCLPAVKLMLQSLRILENNPVDDGGLSHFHIACALGEDKLVQEFLVRRLADANCSKDFFSTGNDAGYAPLHFAMTHGNCATVEVLLDHGANVLAEDCNGSTVLHKAARQVATPGRKIYENTVLRCIAANANVNAIDIFGMTPLELYFKNNTTFLLPLFLEHGARTNFVNPINGIGLLTNADVISLKLILENAKDIANIDPDTGFNAIHNIVSSYSINLNSFELGDIIEKLMEKGCDLHQPDATGKTPLHVAMKWKESSKTVKTLLDFGADINMVDINGNTPLVDCRCYNKTRGILLAHLNKLLHFGYYVNPVNINRRSELSRKYESITAMIRRHRGHDSPDLNNWGKELEEMRTVMIFQGLSFADLLKETFVLTYPRLIRSKRQAIASSLSFSNLYERFTSLGCLLRLQHRRALARLPLIEPAKVSLQLCARRALFDTGRLPDLCSEMIIEFLTNEDIENLNKINE